MSFGCFDTIKKVWNSLSACYALADLARQYQLLIDLHKMNNSPSHFVIHFYYHVSFYLGSMALCEQQ